MSDPAPYADLSLEELLERIRTHRWWKGEVHVIGLLSNWGRPWTAAVFRNSNDTPFAPASPLAGIMTKSGESSRDAAQMLLVYLDQQTTDCLAALRRDRDQALREANAEIEQLTGVPESTALADATGAP